MISFNSEVEKVIPQKNVKSIYENIPIYLNTNN